MMAIVIVFVEEEAITLGMFPQSRQLTSFAKPSHQVIPAQQDNA
jgi:hypothetical protein